MLSPYLLLKLLHVLAVIVWVGGVIMTAVLNARLVRAGDAAGLRALASQNRFIGQTLMGSSALLTLLSGIGMMVVGGTGMPFWISWGMVGVVASMVIGGGVLGRAGARLGRLRATPDSDPGAIAALERSMRLWGWVVLLILISTVAVMVLKPIL